MTTAIDIDHITSAKQLDHELTFDQLLEMVRARGLIQRPYSKEAFVKKLWPVIVKERLLATPLDSVSI